MADYSEFPFSDFTDAEVFALARESRILGDEEFVKVCMDAIIKQITKKEESPATRPAAGGKEADK